MRIVEPSVAVLTCPGAECLRRIERAGRTCYKSTDNMTDASAARFVSMLLKRGHESVIEHESASVLIVCDRGVSHVIVRHRIASYSQESTRYVNYGGTDIAFIKPPGMFREAAGAWESAMTFAERAYHVMLQNGASPQIARSVLPNSLKTELVMTANMREWRHFLRLRTAPAAHPQMREVALMIARELSARVPVLFDEWKECAHDVEGE